MCPSTDSRYGRSGAKRAGRVAVLLVCLTAVLRPEGASAHRPLFAGAEASRPEGAVRVPDPAVSHVIYVEVTPEQPYTWFTFETRAARTVPLVVGVPAAAVPEDVTPAVILFGPGLPEPAGDLPVPPPAAGLGAQPVFSDAPAKRFYEPVTGTESLIVAEADVQLPQAGTYYGVVYETGGRHAKAWVSVGRSEGFAWRDVARLPGWIGAVRRWHEVRGWPRWAWMSMLVLIAAAAACAWWFTRRR